MFFIVDPYFALFLKWAKQEQALHGLPLIYLVIIVIAFFHIKMIIYKTK